ncbi:hypothetical protein EV651_114103 [Kribbella sp. VKM Ac-2571]|uniref:hypothetical protein n=1 Tax=Kribbella sp. VKM Ac-2571 TaxID=2512222 RepID=UPI0010EBB67E|nr:hypothetical protein [Kribbella sp. VKM Ac-2571]TDO55407.1 hypothetical protein EV651_114103 [Kribbella sp. VKM Ac-2571]
MTDRPAEPDPRPAVPRAPAPGYGQQPTSGSPQSGAAQHPWQTTAYPQQPAPPAGHGYPQHLWPEHAQQPVAAVPSGVDRPMGSAVPGVLALLVGLAGLVAPFLPFSNLIDRFPVRQYLAFPFALPALALAVAGLAGNRRGKPAAAIGLILALLALGVGAIMVYNYDFRS